MFWDGVEDTVCREGGNDDTTGEGVVKCGVFCDTKGVKGVELC